MTMGEAVIRATGDSALTVEFENEISIAVNQKVHALVRELEAEPIPGIVEAVPTYRSVMVYYRPEVIRHRELRARILERLSRCHTGTGNVKEVIELPVCYGGEFGPDLREVAAHDGMTPEEVIRRHSENLSFVYAVGFSPGLAYIGSPAPTLTIPRLRTPRVKIPRDSIVVWESQTVTVPFDQPCGWHIIGRSPVHFYDARRRQGSFLRAGQWVRFVPVDRGEYERIRRETVAGTYQARLEREETPWES